MRSEDFYPRTASDCAQGDQGLLAPVRAELLPPVPPRGAAGGDRGYLDLAHRLPLHLSTLSAGVQPHAEARADGSPFRPIVRAAAEVAL